MTNFEDRGGSIPFMVSALAWFKSTKAKGYWCISCLLVAGVTPFFISFLLFLSPPPIDGILYKYKLGMCKAVQTERLWVGKCVVKTSSERGAFSYNMRHALPIVGSKPAKAGYSHL